MKNGRTSEVVRVTSGSEGASAFFWTPVQPFLFFPIAHLFSKVLGFEANAKNRFFFAFLRPCGQKWRFMWRMGDVFRGWPRTIVDHTVIIVICCTCYKTSTNVIFPKTSWPLCFRGSPRESSRGCQRSSGYSPRCKQDTAHVHDDQAAQDTAHVAAGGAAQDTASWKRNYVASWRIQLTLQGGRAAQDTKSRLWLRRMRHKELVMLKTQILTSEVATRV